MSPPVPARSRYRAAIARPTSSTCCAVREDEHRAAEPTAEQARAESAGIDRQLDEQVELRDRDLVVVAEARVALAEEHAGAGEVSGLEGGREPAHALVLGDDVPQPALRDVVQSVERTGLDLGGASGAHEPQRLLQLASPLGVGGVLEAPRRRRSRRSGARRRRGHGSAGTRASGSRAGSRARRIRAGTPPGRGCRTERPPPVALRAGRGGRARAARARSRRPCRGRARAPPRGRQTRRGPLPAGGRTRSCPSCRSRAGRRRRARRPPPARIAPIPEHAGRFRRRRRSPLSRSPRTRA